MAGKTIQEFDFAEFVACSLRLQDATYPEAPELQAAGDTAQWLLTESFNDRLPELSKVRWHYEKFWEDRFDSDCPKSMLRIVPKICKRLHDLAVDYLVMHPTMKYSLSFGRNIVKGSYATVIKPKQTEHPLIVRLRFGDLQQIESKQGPDTVNMLRWLHFRQVEISHRLVRVLNYSIDTEEAWLDFFDESIIRKYLQTAAANLADKRVYPSPGPRCSTCKAPGCLTDAMEVFPLG